MRPVDICIYWSDDDGEYVAECLSMPWLRWTAPTRGEVRQLAYAMLEQELGFLAVDGALPWPGEGDDG